MKKELIEKITRQLKDNILALESAAFAIDGTKAEDISENTIESTSIAATCIIEMRYNELLLEELNQLSRNERLKETLNQLKFKQSC